MLGSDMETMDASQVFRPIEPSDRNRLLQLLHKAFRAAAEEYSFSRESNPRHGSFITREDLDGLIERGLEMHGLFEDGGLIGCVGIREGDSRELFHIEKLAVLPEKRYRGFGRAMMRRAITDIAERGGRAISIGIIDKNEKLKHWYRNLGFVEYERTEPKNLPFAVCLMRLDIT